MSKLETEKNIYIHKNFIYFLFSFIIALRLSVIDNEIFKDRDNYLIYLKSMDIMSEHIFSKGVVFFEPLFYIINYLLLLLLTPEAALYVLVFFVCYSFIYFSAKITRNFFFTSLFLLLIFFQPQTFALLLVTTRQGIGVAILMWALFRVRKEKDFLIWVLTAGFIHNSFLIIGFIYMFGYFFDKLGFKQRKKTIYLLILCLTFNVSMIALIELFNIRPEYYKLFEFNSSGAAFILWSVILTYILIFKRKYSYSETLYVRIAYNFALIGLILYLTSYFLSPIAGRVIGTFIPFVYFILFHKMNILDLAFVFLLLGVNIFMYFNGGAEAFLEVKLGIFIKELL